MSKCKHIYHMIRSYVYVSLSLSASMIRSQSKACWKQGKRRWPGRSASLAHGLGLIFHQYSHFCSHPRYYASIFASMPRNFHWTTELQSSRSLSEVAERPFCPVHDMAFPGALGFPSPQPLRKSLGPFARLHPNALSAGFSTLLASDEEPAIWTPKRCWTTT